MEEKLQLRIYGNASLPTLVYLPGMHGDWTLIGGFRSQVLGRVRFVEMAYPRTLTWSLDDYAAAIEAALAQEGITSGWLLGESFGSQPLWKLVARGKFQAQGVILAGGFVRYPGQWFMQLMEKIFGRMPMGFFVRVVFWYAKFARHRYRKTPETVAGIDEFLARRRTESDRDAARHRVHLVGQNDPRATVKSLQVPCYALSGFLDGLVAWPRVRRWLKKNCPTFREFVVVRGADHAVLNTGVRESAQWVLKWMNAPAACALPVDDSPERAKIKATS